MLHPIVHELTAVLPLSLQGARGDDTGEGTFTKLLLEVLVLVIEFFIVDLQISTLRTFLRSLTGKTRCVLCMFNVILECITFLEFVLLQWFFNETTQLLYLNYNGTGMPPSKTQYVVTNLAVLVNISGSMAAPVQGVTFSNLNFQDTRYTYLDPHGMPSGMNVAGSASMESLSIFRFVYVVSIDISGKLL